MSYLITQLVQIVTEKLRSSPHTDVAELVNHLKAIVESDPHLAGLVSDSRILQINQGNATAFQTLVEGGIAYVGTHVQVNKETLEAALKDFFQELQTQQIKSNSMHSVPFEVPPLPYYFVPRPEISQDLKTQLLTETTSSYGALPVSAIHGLGGIGKSTLAMALAYDEEVRTRFLDGVLWVQLGQRPNLLSLLGKWIEELSNTKFTPSTLDAASSRLRSLLHDKAVLLIVDDAWYPDDVKPFLVGSSRCRLIITTRRAEVADEVGARLYPLNVMGTQQSLTLLSNRLGRNLEGTEREEAQLLAKAVGYHPMALELVAVRVQRGTSWVKLRCALEAEVARLEALESPSSRWKGETRLEASFNLSLNALRQDDLQVWENFVWLGVLAEEAKLTAPLASTLWCVEEVQATERLEILWSEALLLPGTPVEVGESTQFTYRLHDLLHDVACRLLTANEPPGLGLSLAQGHATLLERYRKRTQAGLWHTLPDDSYIHAYLSWHLEKASWIDELHKLLQEKTWKGDDVDDKTDGNGWYQACERVGQTASYLTAINRAWQLAEATETFNGCPSLAIGLQCRYALITASLNSLAENIPVGVMVALVEKKLWTPAQGFIYALQIKEPQHRAEALTGLVALTRLVPYWSEALPEALPEALKAARVVPAMPNRAEALTRLVLYCSEVLPEALEAARKIQDRCNQAKALTKLGAYCSGIVIPSEALETVGKIQYESERVEVLKELIPYLPPALLPRALGVAQEIQSESSRTEVLTRLAPHFSQELLSEFLKAARVIKDQWRLAQVLIELVPSFPDLQQEVLKEVRKIRDVRYRAKALARLVRHSRKVCREAFEAAGAIKVEYDKAEVLSQLLPYLPEELQERLLPKILKIVKKSLNTSYLIDVLSQLVPYYPKVLPEALKIVQKLPDERKRAETLNRLAPYLPKASKDLLPLAMEIVWKIHDKRYRAEALNGLAPHLSPVLLGEAVRAEQKIQDDTYQAKTLKKLEPYSLQALQKALQEAGKIRNESCRVEALNKLVPYLPQSLILQALEIAQGIWNESCRVQVLNSLIPRLSQELLLRTIEITRKIRDERYRVEALNGLVPHLPKELLPQALEIAQGIQEKRYQVLALSSLVLPLPEVLPEKVVEILGMTDDNRRAKSLSEQASNLAAHLSTSLYPLWQETLHILARCRRQDLLEDLQNLIPVIIALGGSEALEQVAHAIQDVGEQWS